MMVTSPSLLFNSALRIMTLNAATFTAKNRRASRVRMQIGRAAFLILLAVLSGTKLSPAQSSNQIGLPVIFVHGICDTPDSFLPAEQAIKMTLRNHYPALYPAAQAPDLDEYVTFYDGTTVWFQIPTQEVQVPESPNPINTVPSSTRFFLVALDDPSESMYQNFDEAAVMRYPIYSKGNELAHIIWEIKTITGAPRVIIVAHSMGGLDTRAYIEGLASLNGTTNPPITYLNDIATLVTLDTPHGGSLFAGFSSSSSTIASWFGACATNSSVDKDEMNPTGDASVIPQLNYQPSNGIYAFQAQPLPIGLTISSIASYRYAPGLFQPYDEGTDDVLTSLTQDLQSNLGALEVEVQHLAEKMLHGKSVSTSECGRADRSTSTD